jgi:hypothetical protein
MTVQLVDNWRTVLAKSTAVWLSVLGAILPEVPDLVLRWLADDSSSQVLTPQTKNWIRGLLMFFVIPLARIIRQQSLQPPAIQPLKWDPRDGR